jgi:uncharacterized membrane protein (UPF0127 family)
MVGLLGTTSLEPESGLLIFPTQAVHTFGMKYPIDILFLDRNKKVVGLRPEVPPYRLTPIFWRAECVLELPPGTAKRTNTVVGDVLNWDSVE